MKMFNGLGMSMATLSRLSDAQSRSISAENLTGKPGSGGMATEGTGALPARDLGKGWKISPSIEIASTETATLANIEGSGAIQHIWISTSNNVRCRNLILRLYWDEQTIPSVEVPLGDFFCCGLENYCHVSSLAVCVNPGRAFNCYWEMPFRTRAKITLENRDSSETATVYYQITYLLTEVPEDRAYFHAQFRRTNPTPYGDVYTILDNVSGAGHYVGTYMTWGVNNSGWWGEGEIKFFMDDDEEFPTICGTGTEDYFCGSHNFDIGTAVKGYPHQYTEYSTPYAGLPEIESPDGVYKSQHRFGMYRWHITDPIRFSKKLTLTIQALGWRSSKPDVEKRRYLPLQDDISSVAFWYQTLPTPTFPTLPNSDDLEIN